jgi:adenosylcobinamide-GDP ribazoletransferase
MKNLFQSLAIAFSMYSTIPMPQFIWRKENMNYALCFFPLIGLIIGGVLYGWFFLAQLLSLNLVLTACGATLIPLAITGGIHMDGFCDTVDALSSHASQEKKQDILKDPHVGTFAILGSMAYFLFTFSLWSQYSSTPLTNLILGFSFALSRSLSGILVIVLRSARQEGLVATFSQLAHKKITAIFLLIQTSLYLTLIVWLAPSLGILLFLAVGLSVLYSLRVIQKDFGGMSGDLAGYFLQLCELIFLLTVVSYQLILPLLN